MTNLKETIMNRDTLKRTWNVITSPGLVMALNVITLGLQIVHQIDQYNRGNRQIGFTQKR